MVEFEDVSLCLISVREDRSGWSFISSLFTGLMSFSSLLNVFSLTAIYWASRLCHEVLVDSNKKLRHCVKRSKMAALIILQLVRHWSHLFQFSSFENKDNQVRLSFKVDSIHSSVATILVGVVMFLLSTWVLSHCLSSEFNFKQCIEIKFCL